MSQLTLWEGPLSSAASSKTAALSSSIVSSGLLSRKDRKASSFREFLKTHNALVKDVPAGAFKSSGTEIATKIVRIQSPNLMSGQLHSGRHG